MKDMFKYNDGNDVVPKGHFKISPSQLSRFFDKTSEWYREFLLGEEAAFQGSTASHLGTCVHACAEMYVNTGNIDHSAVINYVNSITDINVDKDYILAQYDVMAQTLIYQYLENNIPSETELFLYKEVVPGIGIGGSIDSICGSAIVDYKTTSSLNAPTGISRPYYFQQMAYVWLARMHGYTIDTIRLVFITTNQVNRISEVTGKPMKDYPSTVTTIEQSVTDTDIEIIDNTIKLMSESVKFWKETPELRYLIAQDYRLKEAKPIKLNINK